MLTFCRVGQCSVQRFFALRRNTERPITITEGTNQLVEPDPGAFDKALHAANGRRHRLPEPWDGRTGERIALDLATQVAA
ncbi:MAG TPA: hypothetical protein VEM14_09205 [Gemmatimonadaceae bacterium]|nr:hypothetical protein [Gemmatimonadaceae bacterium]